jgi:hypothetical protein
MLAPEDILTPRELSKRLKVSEAWIFSKTRSRCRNPLPAMRVGRVLRFSWPRVSDWLESTAPQSTRRKAA